MKLLLESAIVFFGTLMAAALVALAGPGSVELAAAQEPMKSPARLLASNQPSDARDGPARRPAR